MGHLTEKQGVQLVIQAMPQILRKIPNFRFEIFGGGEYETKLRALAVQIGVSNSVVFHGYMDDLFALENELAKAAAGIAPYVDNKNNFIRYTDPGKVKAYLSSGIPVIVTKVPLVWRDIERLGCGKACDSSVEDVAQTIIAVLKNEKELRLMRKKAKESCARYHWERVFERAFAETFTFRTNVRYKS